MKVLMGSLMNNGNIKIINNTQTSADNAETVKTPFNLVLSVIIKHLLGVYFFYCTCESKLLSL